MNPFFAFCALLFFSSCASLPLFAQEWGGYGDYQTFDLSAGWRRDNLDWKVSDMKGGNNCTYAKAKSHLHFNDIELYSIKGKLRFLGARYYVRLTGTYSSSFKGKAKEQFKLYSPYAFCKDLYSFYSDQPIKKESEFYDFNLVVGYPLLFCNCNLSITPLIGFAYDRQNIRVKNGGSHSSSSFSLSSSNEFCDSHSSDPFSSSSSSDVASKLGIKEGHHASGYRFSWYGPLAGFDFTYRLGSCWTFCGEFQGHFLNQVHRQSDAHSGISFVDHYHHSGSAYGFDGNLAASVALCEGWYSALEVDYKWNKAETKHDQLDWDSIGIHLALGFIF